MQSTPISPEETESLEAVVGFLLEQVETEWQTENAIDADKPESGAGLLSVAFLTALGGGCALSEEATRYIHEMASDRQWGSVAAFYADGLGRIASELGQLQRDDPETALRLDSLAELLSSAPGSADQRERHEAFWSAFFPEGVGIIGQESQRRDELRERRTVTITAPPSMPVVDPGMQVLLTTNALFTVPASSDANSETWGISSAQVNRASAAPQEHWYDHPVPIGAPEKENEIIHGLRGMNAAIGFEKDRGTIDPSVAMPIVISASVTHSGLTPLVRRHIGELLHATGGLPHLEVYAFTEPDTRQLIAETVIPAISRYLPGRDVDSLSIIGVDGRYGRHYSFLKAVAAWWNVMVDPSVIATYKFDLDQTFPQNALVDETGCSAMEHLSNPTWGAYGVDAAGRTIEFGMMAGSLVNESDIDSSLFTLDVHHPGGDPTIDEMVFWSALPQALSTAAEMGVKYRKSRDREPGPALERVHITGGTSAIRVDALRRHRPFTPGFIARAEDQAYLMSVHDTDGPRLSCLHNDGLIMRHDKETFASDAIRAASIGKLIGDYERIILFSAYARAVGSSLEDLKRRFDPFTGSFISRLPTTVTYLRFALRSLRFFAENQPSNGDAFTKEGAARVGDAVRFATGTRSSLDRQLDQERAAWELFYDALDAIEVALHDGDEYAFELTRKARTILDDIVIPAS